MSLPARFIRFALGGRGFFFRATILSLESQECIAVARPTHNMGWCCRIRVVWSVGPVFWRQSSGGPPIDWGRALLASGKFIAGFAKCRSAERYSKEGLETPMQQKVDSDRAADDELAHRLVALRHGHAAWMLLASTNGPLILGSLRTLVDAHPGGVEFEDAVEHLAAAFSRHAEDPAFEIAEDPVKAARRELRGWIKRKLIVEREGQVLATDALQRCFHFLDSLEDQSMTSTASRLATVQRAIENLNASLSSNQSDRATLLRQRIERLQKELEDVERGSFDVLSGSRAEEEIREVYQLAISLRADFRRVEDSFRGADRELRQRILSSRAGRGEIVDELLDGHDQLLTTGEGQVFDSFYRQLVQSAELEIMKARLRTILENENTDRALRRDQKTDLRRLVTRLVEESQRVIQARAQSERDVRGFLKSGLADENIKTGVLVQEILRVALAVDWTSQAVRRAPSPLPPVAVELSNLQVAERLLCKQVVTDDENDLDLRPGEADLEQIDDEFWHAYRTLDRKQLFDETLQRMHDLGRPLTIADLAAELPPTHDLETLSFWLAMAREAGVPLELEEQVVDLVDEEGQYTRFFVPLTTIADDDVRSLDAERLE